MSEKYQRIEKFPDLANESENNEYSIYQQDGD
jgi:hypothetical protein